MVENCVDVMVHNLADVSSSIAVLGFKAVQKIDVTYYAKMSSNQQT